MKARWLLAVCLLAVAAGVAANFAGRGSGAAQGQAGTSPSVPSAQARAAPREHTAAEPAQALQAPPEQPSGKPDVAADLAARLVAGDADAVRAAAADLRRRLRTDPAAWEAAAALLLDPATPETLREALAMVLGTIDSPRTDPLLLDALARFGRTPGFARAALLAIGATREPPGGDPSVDDFFGFGDRPWGLKGPGGIGITVRRDIADDATRSAVGAYLGSDMLDARRAAATAMRHSLDHADALASFVDVLSRESADPVAAVVGESLAARARATADGSERDALLAAVFARAGEPDFEGYRFRMEDDLARVPVPAAQRAVLTGLAAPERPFAMRAFALQVLTSTAVASGEAAVGDTRELLTRTLSADGDDAARDAAARLLRSLPADGAALAALSKASGSDTAWNVRFTALEAYAHLASAEAARAALDAASHDPDERVRGRARELASELESRPR